MSLLFPLVSDVLIFTCTSYVPFDFHVFESRHQCWRGYASVSFLYFHAKHTIKFCSGQQGIDLMILQNIYALNYICVCECVCSASLLKIKEKKKEKSIHITSWGKKKLIIKLEFKDVWINPLVTVLTWRKGRQLNFKHFPNQLKVKNIFILSDKISSEEQNLFPILGHKGFRQFVHAPPHECL